MSDNRQTICQQAGLSRDPRFNGKFCYAVKTPDIFCRTGCPASVSAEKNAAYVSSKDQAGNAGYRPCYARVYQRSIIAPHVVSRVAQGENLTIPAGGIASSADSLVANLRKIFSQHDGMSVKEYQYLNKTLWAKKLLLFLNLSVPDIAGACGYNSLSGFHPLVKSYLNMTPRQNKSQNTDGTNHTVELHIPYAHYYDWSYFIHFQSKRLITAIETITGNEYRRNLCIDGAYGFFTINYSVNSFTIKISASLISQLPAVIKRISSMFDLYSNITLIEQTLKQHYQHLHFTAGIHIPGIMDPYETGIRAICGQQISVAAATGLLNKFADTFAKTDRQGNHYFPDPQDITEHGLASIRMITSKRDTLMRFSQWCMTNRLPDNIDDLINIKGIGKWTVNYIKLRAFADPDIWMGSDLGIKQAMQKYGLIDESLATPWKSYLTLHLWNNL